jgi:hypothetical protein
MSELWPRVHQWWIGPLTIFRNPDAGYGLAINGWLLIGPGQCGEVTWDRATNDRWCYRPFRHRGPHAYSVADALALR